MSIADRGTYLAEFGRLCRVPWPKNRAMTVVCHGHSVPAGYFRTPDVHSLQAYPHLIRAGLAERYPFAVINVIVTAIGGEQSESGAARFASDVLTLKPDVLLIDYALNDRSMGLARAKAAWQSMIGRAAAQNVKVLLLTPTLDQSADWIKPSDPLYQHAEQVRTLAGENGTGLIDSFVAFQNAVVQGTPAASLMSQRNHPNAAGHRLVADAALPWFP